jgi:hypothetical protein
VPQFLLQLLNAGAGSRSADRQERLPGHPTTPATEVIATEVAQAGEDMIRAVSAYRYPSP